MTPRQKNRNKTPTRRRRTAKKPAEVRGYGHSSTDRANIPTEQTSKFMDDKDRKPVLYQPPIRSRDGPVLSWDRDPDLDRPTTHATPLYIREKIHPSAFAESLSAQSAQTSLFDHYDDLPPKAAYEWYKHRGNWQNRIVYGESRHVVASLLRREAMQGKIQMIYFDPPYGIKFRSNMQANSRNRNVKDKIADQPNDPLCLKVFRDSYRNGVHSYLDNIHNIATHCRELLSVSGSLFMQIGSENLHRVALVLDEAFGSDNRVATISFAKSGSSSTDKLPLISNYILWYAKDKNQMKYYQLYERLDSRKEILDHMSYASKLELGPDERKNLTALQKQAPDLHIPEGGRVYSRMPLTSQHTSTTGRSEPYTYKGKEFPCPSNSQWSVSHAGLDRLAQLDRIDGDGSSLRWKLYEDEVLGRKINNMWNRPMSPSDPHYVVETSGDAIERCILMTTDPGDLVFDPTCGSGTTAYAAEKWGRRWITCDSSLVAVNLARQRLATGIFAYHVLQDSPEGAKQERAFGGEGVAGPDYGHDPALGFVYERKAKLSAATLAYDLTPETELFVNQPVKGPEIRVSSPFTVESHSPYRYIDPESALAEPEHESEKPYRRAVVNALEVSGIVAGQERITVEDIEDYANDRSLITHTALVAEEKAALFVAPGDCTVPTELIDQVAEEAARIRGAKKLLVLAFAFEAGVRSGEMEKRGKLEIIKAQTNQDLRIGNLKDTDSDRAFVLIGEPDVDITPDSGNTIIVEVTGYDTYDPQKRQIGRGTKNDVICWMLDTDYDGKSFFARRIHFPNCDKDKQIIGFKKGLEKRLDPSLWESMISYRSAPFPKPAHGRIAVRIITNTHTEMTTVYKVDDLMPAK